MFQHLKSEEICILLMTAQQTFSKLERTVSIKSKACHNLVEGRENEVFGIIFG